MQVRKKYNDKIIVKKYIKSSICISNILVG